MIFLTGEIVIESALTLEKLGELLSEKVFSGLPMRPDRSMDETPAVSLFVLGMDALLYPGGEPGRFTLFITTRGDVPLEADEVRYVKISEYLRERVVSIGMKAEVSELGR